MKIVRNTRRKRSKFFTNTHARTHHHVIKCLVYAIFDSVSFIWILLCMIRIRWMIYVKIFQTSGDNRTSATCITTTTEKTLFRFFPFVIMLKCWQNLNCLFFPIFVYSLNSLWKSLCYRAYQTFRESLSHRKCLLFLLLLVWLLRDDIRQSWCVCLCLSVLCLLPYFRIARYATPQLDSLVVHDSLECVCINISLFTCALSH